MMNSSSEGTFRTLQPNSRPVPAAQQPHLHGCATATPAQLRSGLTRPATRRPHLRWGQPLSRHAAVTLVGVNCAPTAIPAGAAYAATGLASSLCPHLGPPTLALQLGRNVSPRLSTVPHPRRCHHVVSCHARSSAAAAAAAAAPPACGRPLRSGRTCRAPTARAGAPALQSGSPRGRPAPQSVDVWMCAQDGGGAKESRMSICTFVCHQARQGRGRQRVRHASLVCCLRGWDRNGMACKQFGVVLE
eukprot:316661-Chlamydomonas_euryale.AAC.5